MLRVHDLRTYFYLSRGILRAVDGVDLRIGEKEAVGLVGESGCGKTMTALSVMRLVPRPGRVVRGEVLFRGDDLLKLSEEEMRKIRGRRISMVFQDPMTYLNPVIKVGDLIGEVIKLHQKSAVDVKEKVVEALRKTGIPSPSKFAEYYPHQISGGMRQRVLISLALSCEPDLLILDEPTTALDVTVQAQILDLLIKLKEELKTSLLLITHDLGIVTELCDKVYVMYAGKFLEQADVFTIYESPKHPYTIGLLKTVLSIDSFKKVVVTMDGTVPGMIELPQGCRFHPRCPEAKEICRREEPPSVDVEKGHVISCWLYM